MDEFGAGFVHGCGERCGCLEAAPGDNSFCRPHLWRIPSAGLHFLLVDYDHHCRADHEDIEDGDQSQKAKACGFGPNGATGKVPTRVYVDLQKTGGAAFR